MARSPNTQLLDSLRSRLRNGEFGIHAMLPSERALAEEFGVGRSVIRTALAALRREGLLQIYPHRGARIVQDLENVDRLKRVLVRYGHSLVRTGYEIIEILSGISIAASVKNIEIILSFSPDGTKDQDLTVRYYDGAFDGIVFIENIMPPGYEKQLNSAGIPYVVANCESNAPVPKVSVDFRSVGRMAGQRLLASGRKKIGIVSGCLRNHIYRELLAGLRGSLAEEEIYLNSSDFIELSGARYSDAELAPLFQLLSSRQRPEAFFVMRDYRAEPLYRVCSKLGLRIPDDIDVIAYDNLSWPDAERMGLTTIAQPVGEIGTAALEMLARWRKEKARPGDIFLSGRLIERQSIRMHSRT